MFDQKGLIVGIEWVQEQRKLSDLKPNPKNPRTITKDAYKALKKNIERNGYNNRLIINVDGTVLCGNQRLNALRELGYVYVDVLVPLVELTEEQVDDVTVTDNLSAGAWDFDALGNAWDPQKLIEWGMPVEWLTGAVLEKTDKEEVVKDKKPKTCPHCGEFLN